MSDKLSFSSIAATLAAIGAVSLVGCGGSNTPADSPVESKEVPAAAESTGSESTNTADTAASESTDKMAESDTGDKPAEAAAEGDKPAETSAAATPEAKPAAKKTPVKKTGGKKAGAKASCGAGTCG